MDKREKKRLSEADICSLFVSPAVKEAGWDHETQIRQNVTLTPGPIVVRGNASARNKSAKKYADYVLYKEPGISAAPPSLGAPALLPRSPREGGGLGDKGAVRFSMHLIRTTAAWAPAFAGAPR